VKGEVTSVDAAKRQVMPKEQLLRRNVQRSRGGLVFKAHRLLCRSTLGQSLSKEQLLRRNVKRFRGGLVLKAHRRVYHSTLGLRVVKKKSR